MKKIPTIFLRDERNRARVTAKPNPACQWVFDGDGVPTRKWDGTACLWKDGILWKRYDVKRGRPAPDGFVPAQDPDPVTGHWPGWVAVGPGPEDRWFREGHLEVGTAWVEGQTYELIGPKVNGNPEGVESHMFFPHGSIIVMAPRTFEALGEAFEGPNGQIEGIVWHHPDGRMAKIKRRDFGLPWPVKHA